MTALVAPPVRLVTVGVATTAKFCTVAATTPLFDSTTETVPMPVFAVAGSVVVRVVVFTTVGVSVVTVPPGGVHLTTGDSPVGKVPMRVMAEV